MHEHASDKAQAPNSDLINKMPQTKVSSGLMQVESQNSSANYQIPSDKNYNNHIATLKLSSVGNVRASNSQLCEKEKEYSDENLTGMHTVDKNSFQASEVVL